MSTFAYQGKSRHVAGRLHYPDPPEPGTILGPNDTREHLVVLGQDGADTLVGYASTDDLATAVQRIVDGEAPRSIAERTLIHAGQVLARATAGGR